MLMPTDANTVQFGPPGKLVLAELHDSRIESLTLQAHGLGVLRFEHLNVFVEQSSDRYDVWDYRADLLLQHVAQLSLDRPLGSGEYVSDGRVLDVLGREIELLSATDWTPADKVEIVLSSAATLSMRVSNVRLILAAPVKKLDEWVGPLRGPAKVTTTNFDKERRE
jgi:hypothetical protein